MKNHVLVIETDESIRAQIRQTAHDMNFGVSEAQTLSAGLSRTDQPYDIVIIGEYLLNGPLRAVVSRTRNVFPQAAIIILEHTDAGIEAAKGLGLPYITQPFDGSDFQSRLSSQFKTGGR